jgi:hypothetical protein
VKLLSYVFPKISDPLISKGTDEVKLLKSVLIEPLSVSKEFNLPSCVDCLPSVDDVYAFKSFLRSVTSPSVANVSSILPVKDSIDPNLVFKSLYPVVPVKITCSEPLITFSVLSFVFTLASV